MSALAKPFITSSKTSKPAAPVNAELLVAFDKLKVQTTPTADGIGKKDVFQIIFKFHQNDVVPESITWEYEEDLTSRDEDFDSAVALLATILT